MKVYDRAITNTKTYNRIAHIKRYTQSKRQVLTVLHCSPYTKVASSLGGLQPK